MVTLEQIKLLETKVVRAIDVVTRITGENAYLKGKLENYQKRIDELEVLIQRFKEDQGRIEDGILSALDRLNEFEAAMENSIAPAKPAAEKPVPEKPVPEKTVPERAAPEKPAPEKNVPEEAALMPEVQSPAPEDEETGDALMFSIPEDDAFGEDDDSEDEDGDSGEGGIPEDGVKNPGDSGGGAAELDIF
ncbi:MAG: cell division protein ZapB [Treponema sp.]|jgi:predicted nuclease with TOPRIM domain|nr:cell division protein ZapB [Treponema sp.]